MRKLKTSQLLIGLFISGLIGGCASKPTSFPPDVMASSDGDSGFESERKNSNPNSPKIEDGSFADRKKSTPDTGFSIEIQENEVFPPGLSSEGPDSNASPLPGGPGSQSGGIDKGSQSGGIDEGSQSGGIGNGPTVGEGRRSGGINDLYGSFVPQEESSRSGGNDGSKGLPGSGGAPGYSGDAPGKPYEPEAQVPRLKPFEPNEDLQDIHFDYDKHDLDASAKGVLNNNSGWMKQNLSSKVEIQGHCDERGTNNYNLGLGERRAISIKKYLIARGISKDRLFTISYGEERPFCQDNTESCWKSNRRGHFLVSN